MTEHDIFGTILCVINISYVRMRGAEQVGGDVMLICCATSVVSNR